MQYNTQREQLIMPEYGRGIQYMVDLAISLPDRQERQRCANTIISIMSRVQPENAGAADYEVRLWNHLAKISRYKLDIDYPVEIVPEQEAMEHPKPLPYPMKKIRRRHYGHLVESALQYAQTLPDGEERTALVGMVANQMKQDLFVWNRDSMDENLVMQDIRRYSDGQLQLPSDFRFATVGVPSNAQLANNGSTKSKKKKR
ncbi:MAG: DUF4290 domain-containing protein [Bacteroidaceae bacterium]|jgi:hypothetical protein|nr:DUF4290 domain-containing protein [Bacteroidaceae bacterium]